MKIIPKKSLGQNFLTDINIINKIIDIGDIKEKDDILEVGPGTGNLTREIIKKKPKKIFLIEKDKLLYRNLKKKFNDKINIINEDILNYDFINDINPLPDVKDKKWGRSHVLALKALVKHAGFNNTINNTNFSTTNSTSINSTNNNLFLERQLLLVQRAQEFLLDEYRIGNQNKNMNGNGMFLLIDFVFFKIYRDVAVSKGLILFST